MRVIQLTLLFAQALSGLASAESREQDFNFGWKFLLQADNEAYEGPLPRPDRSWRDVRLPHDWSVEHPFSEELEGCTGYLPGGVGWYQKHFKTPTNAASKRTYVLFDGVYNNATFWLNGVRLGENPYGYSPAYFDLTEHLAESGGENVLTVHVDHSRYADGRWYTGSGIYRNVRLITLNELHIPIWGTYLTTPQIADDEATVELETQVANTSDREATFTLSSRLVSAAGGVVAESSDQLRLAAGEQKAFRQTFTIAEPALWSPDSPSLYHAVTSLGQEGASVDEYTTPFGIRSLEFSADRGFLLNGEPTYVKGVCLHHDGGLVGAAVPKGVWRRRLSELKAGGVNAIRLAHNPFSQEFLDLCDEMGFLVQNEFFDEWDYAKDKRLNYHDRHDDRITRGYVEHFQEWAQSDLERTMLRDRNHPCVFQWSIGNEIEWTYLHLRYVTGFWKDPNDPQKSGAYWGSPPLFEPEELKKRYDAIEKGEHLMPETARKLAAWTRALDTTRPITINLIVPHVSHVNGVVDAVDIAGYSYRGVEFGWAKKHFPDAIVTINENPGTWEDWKHVLEWPGVFSQFMWTGIAYLGESHNQWPNKHWQGDMLNLAGFRNRGWDYFASVFVDDPHLSLGTEPLEGSKFRESETSAIPEAKDNSAYRWGDTNRHWNYEPGEKVLVDVCSNHDRVELFLNGRSLGVRSLSECPDRLFRWIVPFEPGTLTAKAGAGEAAMTRSLATTTEPTGLTVDCDKQELRADGYDVAHLVVQLHDQEGRPVKTENRLVTFEIEGDARLLGVDNGARDNVQDFQSSRLRTDQGRALMILQSNRQAGDVRVKITAEGLPPQSVSIAVR
ncbi:Beta-galactosidase [Planctomycetes bacterium MalM25]|nr:Beta-galactosidase [Planctomycetes bacterium MalM25]